MRHSIGLVATAALLAADVAVAADSVARQRSPLGGCLCALVLFVVYRFSGVPWGLSAGSTVLPAVFGWFVWRERQYGTFVRAFALVMAVLQLLAFLGGLLYGVLSPSLLAGASAPPQEAPVVEARTASSPVPVYDHEKDELGLHPEGRVVSEPAGATVFLDDKRLGTAPLRARFDVGRRNVLRLELDGYFPAQRVVEPNANQALTVTVALEKAATLEVQSTPPGAVVLVDGGVVIPATPGRTPPLDRTSAELVIKRDGFIAERRLLDLAKEPRLEVTLRSGVRLSLDSDPPGANVSVDGALLGLTPLEAWVSPRGRHTVTFSRAPLAPVTRTLSDVKGGARVAVRLIDQELLDAEARVARLRVTYDTAEARLADLQRRLERAPWSVTERQLDEAQRAMEDAANAFEEADRLLKDVRSRRSAAP